MAYTTIIPITQRHITGENRPNIKIKKMKKIPIHWTGNRGLGANAIANRNYFENVENASAQYVVDDKMIIETMPANEVAYAVGAKAYTAFGKSLCESGYTPNFFTCSIEFCVNADSDFSKAEMNVISLTVYLLLKFGLKPTDVVRHYDITGKMCPDMYLTDKDWKEFLARVTSLYNTVSKGVAAVKYEINDVMEIIAPATIRKGPDIKYQAFSSSYKTGDRVTVLELTDGFYRTGKGWVSAQLVKDIPDYPTPVLVLDKSASGIVTADPILNIRSTPSTRTDNKVGTYPKGELIILLEEVGEWYKTDKGYVHGAYVDRQDMRRAYTLGSDHKIFSDDDLTLVIGDVKAGANITIFGEYQKNGNRVLAIATNRFKGFIKG